MHPPQVQPASYPPSHPNTGGYRAFSTLPPAYSAHCPNTFYPLARVLCPPWPPTWSPSRSPPWPPRSLRTRAFPSNHQRLRGHHGRTMPQTQRPISLAKHAKAAYTPLRSLAVFCRLVGALFPAPPYASPTHHPSTHKRPPPPPSTQPCAQWHQPHLGHVHLQSHSFRCLHSAQPTPQVHLDPQPFPTLSSAWINFRTSAFVRSRST